LHAAVLLLAMLDDVDTPKMSLERELKRLQLFEGPTQWAFISWRDLESSLVLARPPKKEGEVDAEDDPSNALLMGADATTAGDTGLYALELPPTGAGDFIVRHAGSISNRDVAYRWITVEWDGTSFAVNERTGSIPAGEASEAGAEKKTG
jgi:hypothetical protein